MLTKVVVWMGWMHLCFFAMHQWGVGIVVSDVDVTTLRKCEWCAGLYTHASRTRTSIRSSARTFAKRYSSMGM